MRVIGIATLALSACSTLAFSLEAASDPGAANNLQSRTLSAGPIPFPLVMKYREDLLPDGNVRFEQTALLGLILASRQNNFNENIISASREGLDMWLERMQKAALIPKYAEEAQSFIDYYSTASQEFPSTTIPLPEVRSQN